MTEHVIEAQGLVKKYGRLRALDGLDVTVDAGEVRGFLGPNGAGKSTTIRALLGQLRLTGGVARLFGRDAWSEAMAIHPRIAYVPGDVALWPQLTGGEALSLLGTVQGRPDVKRRSELIERFEFDPTKRIRTYSKGNRQKTALIAALASDADLFLLDEPTSGLDPLMESVFQDCVREIAHSGRTVLLSSHILGEVEALCEKVSIIRSGRIVLEGTLDELRHSVRVTFTATTTTELDLNAVPGSEVVDRGRADAGFRVSFTVGHADVAAAVRAVDAARPSALTVEPPSLDALFLANYRTQGSQEYVA